MVAVIPNDVEREAFRIPVVPFGCVIALMVSPCAWTRCWGCLRVRVSQSFGMEFQLDATGSTDGAQVHRATFPSTSFISSVRGTDGIRFM